MTPKLISERQERGRLLSGILMEARDWLMGSVRSMVPLYEDAEDIVQDVLHQFTGAFDEIRSLEASSSWLYRAAKNRVSDFYRKRGRTLEGSHTQTVVGELDDESFLENLLFDPTDSPEAQFELAELEAELEKAIDALPPRQKEVFIWHEIEGLSYTEIEALTGEPLNTLLSRKRYAVLNLRKQLIAFYK